MPSRATRFLGDKHLFFWLLTNRMAPPAVFALPFFQLYSSVGLFDTHIAVALAHCLFNVPLAVWILEGFMRGVPREIDETAYIDGYSFPRFFVRIFMPLIASGIGVAAFFCFMFSWVELLLARTLTAVDAKPIAATMTRTVSASGLDWGVLAAAGVLTIMPGALVICFVRNYIAKGFALGGCDRRDADRWHGWPGPGRRRCFFVAIVRAARSPDDAVLAIRFPRRRASACCGSRPRAATGSSSACSARPSSTSPGSASSASRSGARSSSA